MKAIKAFFFASILTIFASGQAHALRPLEIQRYSTAAILTASTAPPGSIGYAVDTQVFYLMQGSSWAALSTIASLANGATWSNAVDGTTTLTEGGETEQHVVTNNLITLTSDSGATYAITPATAIAGDLTLSGGASALTFGASSSSVVTTDNSATGLVMGSTGRLNLLTLDTRDGVEQVTITGVTGQPAFTVPTGTSTFTEAATFSSTVAASGAISGLRPMATKATNYGVSAPADCNGTFFSATDGVIFTLPATAAANKGCMITFINSEASVNSVLLSIAPNAADKIDGAVMAVYSGTNGVGVANKAWNNTKATSKHGDYTTLVSDGTASGGTWYIIGGMGIWASTP